MKKLPKEWHILPKNKEEAKIIGKWFDQSKFACEDDKHFYENEANLWIHGGIRQGNVYNNDIGIEISFEDFKRLVLKENIEIDIVLW